MNRQNMAQYLSQIQQIRLRIQSKQFQRGQIRPKVAQLYQGQSKVGIVKIDPNSIVQDLSKRRPLQSAQNKSNRFNERVKELDSVSERIKHMLAYKRAPSHNNQNNFTPVSVIKTVDIHQKSEKITSLFQKGLNIAESKVAQVTFSQFKNRDLNTLKERLNSNNINTFEPQVPRVSQIYYASKQQKNETSPISDEKYTFDIKAFKKRFIKQINKDHSTDRLSQTSCPIITNTATKRQKYDQLFAANIVHSSSPPQSKKILELLFRQIQLQTKLRSSKQKFDAFRAQNKMVLLREQLTKRKIKMSERELQEWVKIEEQEFDPFVSIFFTKQFDFSELIANLTQAKSHWQQKLRKCVSLEQLQRQQFKIRQVEGFKRDYIYLQDLVCFINLNNDSCLKNRDLFSLFKHFMLIESAKVGQVHRIKNETFFTFIAN